MLKTNAPVEPDTRKRSQRKILKAISIKNYNDYNDNSFRKWNTTNTER